MQPANGMAKKDRMEGESCFQDDFLSMPLKNTGRHFDSGHIQKHCENFF